MTSTSVGSPVSSPPVPRSLHWLAGAVLVGVVAACLASAAFGPLVGAAALALPLVVLSLLRQPLLALALPLVVAPVGLRPLPVGGLQVIHVASVAAIGGVLLAVALGRVRLRPPAAMAFGVLFVATMFASAVVAENPLGSLRVGTNYLLGVCLAVAAAVVVRDSPTSLPWLLRGWTVAAAALVVPALPAALSANDQLNGGVVQGRVQGAFAQPNDFGEFSLLGAVAAGALLAGSRTRSDRLLGSVGLLVSLAGVAVSFSRGTWLGALAALLTVAVLSPRLRGWAALLIGLIPVALLLGAALGAPPFPTIVARFVSLLTGGANPQDDRPILYAQALRVFAAHPVLGIGPGGFLATNHGAESVLIRRTYLHGHSVLLTIAAEVGLIGAVALLAYTVALAAATLAARSRLLAAGDLPVNARLAVLAAGLVGVAVHGLVDVVYMNPLLIPLAWLLTGLVAGETARSTDRYPLPSSTRPDAPR